MYIQYSMYVNVISIVLFYNITPTIRQINNMILFILMSHTWFFEVCQFMERRVTYIYRDSIDISTAVYRSRCMLLRKLDLP